MEQEIIQEEVNFALRERLVKVLLFPLALIGHIVALPVNFIAWLIPLLRRRRYNPEKAMCPACGFKGDSGTNNKSCSILCRETNDAAQAAIQHSCLRCSAKFFSKLFVSMDKWGERELYKDRIARLTAEAKL